MYWGKESKRGNPPSKFQNMDVERRAFLFRRGEFRGLQRGVDCKAFGISLDAKLYLVFGWSSLVDVRTYTLSVMALL